MVRMRSQGYIIGTNQILILGLVFHIATITDVPTSFLLLIFTPLYVLTHTSKINRR